jgi:hypothetical protein
LEGDVDEPIKLEDFQTLTKLIYAAIPDESRWQDFISTIHRLSGGVHTHLFGYDIPSDISLNLIAGGYGDEYIDSDHEHYELRPV